MAPSITTRGGVPTGPRRGGGRGRGGGISKRRDGPLKMDLDGDVSMSAVSSGQSGSRRGRGGISANSRDPADPRLLRTSSRLATNVKHYGTAGSKAHFAETTKLKITGVKESKAASNPDGGERSVVQFIERKLAKRMKVTINKSIMDGDVVWINVSNDFAPEILTLNGFEHAGHPLTIIPTNEPWPSAKRQTSAPSVATNQTKEALRIVAASRYNAEKKLLDLSFLGQDPTLTTHGFLEGDNRAMKAFAALCVVASENFKTAKEKKDGIRLVSLAGNNLDNVSPVFDIATIFPGIIGLDLSNNSFDKLNRLSRWRNHFRDLKILNLAGNPLQGQEPELEKQLKQWFPKLQQVDDKVVRTEEEIIAQSPVPIPQLGFDFRDVNGVGENFLREFLVLYDSDREGLASKYYDEDSQFSLAVIPTSAKSSGEAQLPWKSYIRFSRNIKYLGPRNKENQRRLFRGNAMIGDLWKSLPASKHPSAENTDKLFVDAHVVNHLADPSGTGLAVDGLVVTVTGEFEEVSDAGKLGRRAFSRHFLLGPAKPGRGLIRVISDQLTLRGWQPLGDQVDAILPPNTLDIATKEALVLELTQRTGMTLEYSKMCLEGPRARWNFHLALASFEELRHSLGPEAFINQQPPVAV